MTKHAFVTGATGFIGTNLVHLLVREGWKVTALHRATSDLTYLKNLPINLAEGSITDPISLLDAIPQDTEVVFHLAGDTNMWSQHNDRQKKINVDGTENMIQAAIQQNVKTFIHTSSVSAWGDMSGMITEETPQKGNRSWVNYEYTKWAGEQKALKGINHNMKVVILNPAMVVGPYDANNWGRLFFALRDGELPGISDGCMSVAHVEEVAKAHLTAVTKGRSGENYILAGVNCHFSDFIREVAKVSGITNIPKHIPAFLLRTTAYVQAGIALFSRNEPDLTPELAKLMTRRNVTFSSEKAQNELHYWVPPMRKTIQDCYDWLKEEELL